MKKNGFTLIELMLVVVIIATLAALVAPRLSGRVEQAKVTAANADIFTNLSTALDLYQMDNGFYPSTEQGLSSLRVKPESSPVPADWNGPYIKRKPIDPWGNPYVYVSPGIHNRGEYDLYSYGYDGVEGGGNDVVNWEIE